mgnify:CR=1 FL=1
MKTKITELLGIKYPIIQVAWPGLQMQIWQAAVSNAGGAGIIATGGRTVEWTRDEIRKAKDLTAKPFGVNIMLMAPNIAEIIDGFISEDEYAIWTNVWNMIQDKFPLFVENNLYLSGLGIRNAIEQRFSGRFRF